MFQVISFAAHPGHGSRTPFCNPIHGLFAGPRGAAAGRQKHAPLGRSGHFQNVRCMQSLGKLEVCVLVNFANPPFLLPRQGVLGRFCSKNVDYIGPGPAEGGLPACSKRVATVANPPFQLNLCGRRKILELRQLGIILRCAQSRAACGAKP